MDENFTQSISKSVNNSESCDRTLTRHQLTLEFIRQFARSYCPAQISGLEEAPALILN